MYAALLPQRPALLSTLQCPHSLTVLLLCRTHRLVLALQCHCVTVPALQCPLSLTHRCLCCFLTQVRCDILIERRVIGRILGKGGRDLEALQLSTATKVFVIDKYPPPNEGDDHRLLVLIGQPDALRVCKVCA